MKAFAYGMLPSKLSRDMIIRTPRSRQELQERMKEHLQNPEEEAAMKGKTRAAAQRRSEGIAGAQAPRAMARDREKVVLKKYEGNTDPKAHVETYARLMRYLGIKKELWSQQFSNTLVGRAQRWSKCLSRADNSNFRVLSKTFIDTFTHLGYEPDELTETTKPEDDIPLQERDLGRSVNIQGSTSNNPSSSKKTPQESQWTRTKYCTYHDTTGHDTSHCRAIIKNSQRGKRNYTWQGRE